MERNTFFTNYSWIYNYFYIVFVFQRCVMDCTPATRAQNWVACSIFKTLLTAIRCHCSSRYWTGFCLLLVLLLKCLCCMFDFYFYLNIAHRKWYNVETVLISNFRIVLAAVKVDLFLWHVATWVFQSSVIILNIKYSKRLEMIAIQASCARWIYKEEVQVDSTLETSFPCAFQHCCKLTA